MTRLIRLSNWLAVVALYWLCAFWLLFWISPIDFDGSGPTATFFESGRHLTPTLAESSNNRSIRLQFLYPYWIAASIITLVGCGLGLQLASKWKLRPLLSFLAAALMTLISLLIGGAVSDACIDHRIYSGPGMYLDFSHAWPFLKVVMPMSVLAGFLALARSRALHAEGSTKRQPQAAP
jgi:hypothetical protein